MTPRELVRSKLDADLVQKVSELAEQTELEEALVLATLTELKAIGECKRVPDGWILTGFVAQNGAEPRPISMGPAPAPEPVAPAPQPEPETVPMARPKKTAPKAARAAKKAAPEPRAKRKYTRRQPAASAPTIAKTGNGALEYSLTERRELAIDRRDGSGERALIAAADALRLADFLALVRPAFETVAG